MKKDQIWSLSDERNREELDWKRSKEKEEEIILERRRKKSQ